MGWAGFSRSKYGLLGVEKWESKYSASGCMTKVHNYQGGVRGSVGKMLSSSKKKK
ncbi:hypothetical protein PanWU01x14_140290, partial [Parasponia andersonii]